MFNMPNEGCWKIMSYFHKGGVLKLIFRGLMVGKRKHLNIPIGAGGIG